MISYLLWLAGGFAFAALCRAAYRFGCNVDEKAILGRNPFLVTPEQNQPAPPRTNWGPGARIPYRPGDTAYCTTAFAYTFTTAGEREDMTNALTILRTDK